MDKKRIIKVLKEKSIKEIYNKLMLWDVDSIKEEEYINLLSIALILINSDDYETRIKGYEIIVNYSIIKEDMTPLYDISNIFDNTPVIKMIQSKYKDKVIDNIYDEVQSIAIDKIKTTNGICYSNEQIQLGKKFERIEGDSLIIAPTSFGKSELINDYVYNNYNYKNICIIVPTKTLVNQVRRGLMKRFSIAEKKPKIITHYDTIIRKDNRNVFVLTQERLFKLLYDRKSVDIIDVLLIDEAHNIFRNEERAILLSKILLLLKLKNSNLIVKYFSPIINNEESLYLKDYINNIQKIKAYPLIKSEKIFYADFKEKKSYYYNELFDSFEQISILNNIDKYQYIINKSKNKNILYCNTPNKVKKTAEELYDYLTDIDSEDVDRIISDISEYVNENYDLIKYIKRGIVYHFGDIPDNVRVYIEECVKKYNFIKYVICSSTLLEGVNMPFDCMFICDKRIGISNMTYAQLKNLIGRVNRYNEIFNYENVDLKRLISDIYFINDDMSKDNFFNYISKNLKYDCSQRLFDDKVENPMLIKSGNEMDSITRQSIINLQENKECNDEETMIVKTQIGKKMITSNIIEIDIINNEKIIQERIDNYKINNNGIIDKIYDIFFKDINIISKNKNNINRLSFEQARSFYEHMINNRKNNTPLKERVSKMVYYWKNFSQNPKCIYVGERWGMKKRSSMDRIPSYIDITSMTDSEIINYAILRIQQEEKYIDYVLLKFIELLSVFGIITDEEYTLIKYGTNDPISIYFIRDGLSSELVTILTKKYKKYIRVDNGYYTIDKNILLEFDENSILLNELEYYLT